jgi:NodT family efflux transporter outer membrane factor (OMF) lipoprotein
MADFSTGRCACGWLAMVMTAVIGLSACSEAPTYQPPALAVTPTAFREAGPWVPAEPKTAGSGDWWQGFGDPLLDRLEARIASDNPTLAAALARHDEAQAYVGEVRASLLPSIGIGGNLTANRQSNTRPLRGANQPDLYGAHTLDASINYEADLWGRVRNSVAQGRANAEAAADDAAAIHLSLQARLATDYVELRGLDRQAQVLAGAVADYTQADAVTRNRFAGGIASGIDVGASGALLADAEAQIADVRNGRALLEHAIASLVGVPPESLIIAPAVPALSLPAVPLNLPSTLLQRRPDVAAAERRVFAANRAIGVARAAFFPSLQLGGEGGFQSSALAELVSAPSLFWTIGPSLALNLFDGGRRHARVAEARAAWAEAGAHYREVALSAFQQVDDGLSQLHNLGDEATAEDRAAAQAADAERASYGRYVKGVANYLDVLTVQTTALTTRRRAVQVGTLQLLAAIDLVRALGGGWTPSTTASQIALKPAASAR